MTAVYLVRDVKVAEMALPVTMEEFYGKGNYSNA